MFFFLDQQSGGTQFKMKMNLLNGTSVIFKPSRTKRDEVAPANQFFFAEFERHTSEIAAFHLDRLAMQRHLISIICFQKKKMCYRVMGSRRAMPVSGRTLHMVIDILRLAYPDLQYGFFISPANNLCFFETSFQQYGDTFDPVCGDGYILEVRFLV